MIDFSPDQKVETISDLDYQHLLSGLRTSSGYRFYDNSTLSDFRVCFRRGYFRHIRNFEREGVKPALIFGSSWHSAMDFAWGEAKKLRDKELIDGGFEAFKAYWNSTAIIERDELDLFPRTPGYALTMLHAYVERYASFLRSIDVIAIEQPFIVPLSEEDDDKLMYIGKIDKAYEEAIGIYILDHKTTSSFASSWLDSWSPNGQIDGYSHAGYSTYGDRFRGCIIDGALMQKKGIPDFRKVPVSRIPDQLDAWLWETLMLIDDIRSHEELLMEERAKVKSGNPSTFLPAFPKNPSMCTNFYGTCPYLDLCKFQANPECHACEDGFVENKWVPFNIQENLDGSFNITPREGE